MSGETTYPLRVAARLTGLSPDLLRAWERRYAVVAPERTPGGTRRYSADDLDRLRMLKAAVDAGHRIGEIAKLDREALRQRIGEPDESSARDPLKGALNALRTLDASRADFLISGQLAALGPSLFARQFALPLLEQVGDAWQDCRICVAAEHLGSGILRSLLGSALRPNRASRNAPPIIFTTLSGERHELGLLVAALTALGAGGNPAYLGPDLPVFEIEAAVDILDAAAVAISAVSQPREIAERDLALLRDTLPRSVEIWAGGPLSAQINLPERVEHLNSLDVLENRVEMLDLGGGHASEF